MIGRWEKLKARKLLLTLFILSSFVKFILQSFLWPLPDKILQDYWSHNWFKTIGGMGCVCMWVFAGIWNEAQWVCRYIHMRWWWVKRNVSVLRVFVACKCAMSLCQWELVPVSECAVLGRHMRMYAVSRWLRSKQCNSVSFSLSFEIL